ncbi:MAG: DinB family protein [Armatimonadetes bacterium]|nr:DinB family protein [Armatimonadota bacterium]
MEHYDVAPISGMHGELGTLVAAWQDGTREWQENLEHPCLEAMTWQAYQDGPSIGAIMMHLISCDRYWLACFAEGKEFAADHPAMEFDMTIDQYKPFWPAPPNEPIEWYYKMLADSRKEMFKLISRQKDPAKQFERKSSTATYRWIVAHLVQHDSYCGGQMVLLHEMWKKLSAV